MVSSWHIGATQLLAQHTSDNGDVIIKAIREALQEGDTYHRLTDRNAVSMADGLRHVLDLRMVLDRHIQSDRRVGFFMGGCCFGRGEGGLWETGGVLMLVAHQMCG